MVLASPSNSALRQAYGIGHYCPVCLKRVAPGQARRGAYQEICDSGMLEVALLACPTCGVVLAAEIAGAGDTAAHTTYAA